SQTTQPSATPSNDADTSSSGATPIMPTRPRVSPGPATAPQVPASAISGNRRRDCATLQMSVMKIQNTDTTNRLKTLTQTKNSTPSARGESSPDWVNSGTKPSRQAMNTRLSSGTTMRRGNRETSAPNRSEERRVGKESRSQRAGSHN